jgi:hypothetical protein
MGQSLASRAHPSWASPPFIKGLVRARQALSLFRLQLKRMTSATAKHDAARKIEVIHWLNDFIIFRASRQYIRTEKILQNL